MGERERESDTPGGRRAFRLGEHRFGGNSIARVTILFAMVHVRTVSTFALHGLTCY